MGASSAEPLEPHDTASAAAKAYTAAQMNPERCAAISPSYSREPAAPSATRAGGGPRGRGCQHAPARVAIRQGGRRRSPRSARRSTETRGLAATAAIDATSIGEEKLLTSTASRSSAPISARQRRRTDARRRGPPLRCGAGPRRDRARPARRWIIANTMPSGRERVHKPPASPKQHAAMRRASTGRRRN